MKTKIIAFIIMILVLFGSLLNTYALGREIDRFIGLCEALSLDGDSSGALIDVEELFAEFTKSEQFMSVTVNHDDLTVIEELFSEMIGYLKVDDPDGAKVAKSRLTDALSHLRRLSGINLDAII